MPLLPLSPPELSTLMLLLEAKDYILHEDRERKYVV